MRVWMHVHVHVRVRMHMHVRVHVHARMEMHARMGVHVRVHVHVCMHMRVAANVHVRAMSRSLCLGQTDDTAIASSATAKVFSMMFPPEWPLRRNSTSRLIPIQMNRL